MSLSLSIGSNQKKVTIVDIESRPVKDGNPNERIFISTKSDDGAEYKCNEVWVKDYQGNLVVKSLWLNYDDTKEKLLATSLMGQLLTLLNIDNTNDLIGKEVTVKPKDNGFMAICL